MEKTTIPRLQVISDLRDLFVLPANGMRKDDTGCSFCTVKENDTANFSIDKKHFERYEVLQKLNGYFADKVIDGGWCRVDNITFVWTQFHIELVNKKE
jgi:hypothetical protein